MHPYAGNPGNFPASVNLIDDSDAPDASNFNAGPEGIADRTAYLLQNDFVGAVSNWHRGLLTIDPSLTDGAPVSTITYDPFYQRWYACVLDVVSAHFFAYTSLDGLTWTVAFEDTGLADFAIACAVNPTTGLFVAFRTNTTTNYVTSFPPGSSFTNTAQPFQNAVDVGVSFFVGGLFGFVGAKGYLTGTITGSAANSATGTGLWNDDTASLPAGWGASVTANPLCYLAATATAPVLGALIAQCGTRPGTDTSRLMAWPGYVDITPAFLGGTAQQIRGVAWSDTDQLWGVLSIDGDGLGHGTSPANAYLYTSPDAVTWTLVHTFSSFIGAGLATLGSVWCVFGASYAFGNNTVLYSNNVVIGAGCTFNASAYSDTRPIIDLTVPRILFQSSGNQLLRSEYSITGARCLVATSLRANVPSTGAY